MNLRFSKYFVEFSGLGIILFYYFVIISGLGPLTEYGKLLSLSIATDSSYLSLLLQRDFPLFREGISFSYIPFIFDRSFVSLFGYEGLWVVNIIYKSLAFIVLILGIEKLLKPNEYQLFLISVIVGLFFCVDFSPFADRYPRPQFTNIFFFAILIFNLCVIKTKKYSFNKIIYFFYGAAHACLAITNLWDTAVLSLMSLYVLLIIKNIRFTLYIFSGFLILLIPMALSFFLGTNIDHSEYLGLKVIYDPLAFLIDYFNSIIKDKYILLTFCFLLLSSLVLKRQEEIKLFILSASFTPLPFLILGKTIQSYHLLISLRDFIIVLCIVHMCYLMQINRLKIFKFEVPRFNSLCFILINLITLSLIVNYGNSWIDRANNKYSELNQYSKVFNYLDKTNIDCRVVSNDININYYWSNIIGSQTFPNDGFINNSSLEDTLKDIKISLNVLSGLGMNYEDKDNINKIIRYASHNYFVSTRSTMASSLFSNNAIDKGDYIYLNKNIDSMQPWTLSPPKEIYQNLKESYKVDMNYLKSKNLLVIYTNLDKGILNYKVKNYCF